ncbi:hypothetical protein IEQ34_017095 [Dendrobium chrysotoxum]|uniref:Uncharacterized protein n=1 Tax=Dendrobium chrysotoxum TaxID=161865 RepID=A0AAV7G8P4_DENCH|nr:hypothetical protein IEQ34_017095 [Dendrobium chrysotoxum]
MASYIPALFRIFLWVLKMYLDQDTYPRAGLESCPTRESLGHSVVTDCNCRFHFVVIVRVRRLDHRVPKYRPKGISNARLKGYWEKKRKMKKIKIMEEKVQEETAAKNIKIMENSEVVAQSGETAT